MTIEVLVAVAGGKFFLPPGIHEVTEEVGEMLVKAGHAKEKTSPKASKKTKPEE